MGSNAMQNCYSQKLEMQIPKGNVNSLSNSSIFGFLKSNFIFPSNNLNEIADFISGDLELKRMVYNIPELISSEFPNCPVALDFMKFTPPEEKILKIVVKTQGNVEESINKEALLKDKLLDDYNATENEFFIRVEA